MSPTIDLLRIAPEVRAALDDGRAVVALESTITTHGLPRPDNLAAARAAEAAVRAAGAVPATVATRDGRILVGLEADELEALAAAEGIPKVSRQNLAAVLTGVRLGRHDRLCHDDRGRTWPASRSSPRAASAASTAAAKGRWTSAPTWTSWRARR